MIIDGKVVAKKIRDGVKAEITKLGFQPALAVIFIGDHWESRLYIEQKKIACQEVGIKFSLHEFKSKVELKEVLSLIQKLNEAKDIHGIIVQLPITVSLDLTTIQTAIDPTKDVDGFHPINRGLLFSLGKELSQKIMVPCTPAGCIKLLDEYGVEITGKKAVVVGRSNIVGKPLSYLLLQRGATVTICHSQTKNLAEHTKQAEILVVAVGRPKLITKEMVQEDAIVIDVGLNRVPSVSQSREYMIVGDVDFTAVKDKVKMITPVPGGVGPMTVAMLLQNTLKAATS